MSTLDLIPRATLVLVLAGALFGSPSALASPSILADSAAAPSVTQTLPANAAQTNLPTATMFSGAQNPPYICCWNAQGQFVTFSFTTAAGAANLILRYSAGDGLSTRVIQIDGVTAVTNQIFKGTADWNTWATLGLTATLTEGAHTLTIVFDTPSGSTGALDLDNLTVTTIGGNTAAAPDGVTVSLGYADTTAGLTPWFGSPNTVFIGTSPQCCATHGPSNGQPSYDAGAIEISNAGTAAVTVSAVSVEFGGGSNPALYSIWSTGTPPVLPQSVPPGGNLILTVTKDFNFDTSDTFGEACHPNSGVVPVVHVTFDTTVTDYLDSHQILNSDGADKASCPGAQSEELPFTVVIPGAQPPAAPVNDVAPSTAGTPIVSRIMSGFTGAWNGSPPPTITAQWVRCDADGNNCVPIANATTATYIPTADDVNSTLRFQVAATNVTGATAATSAPTALIQAGPAVAQMGNTSTGFTSQFIFQHAQFGSIFTAPSSGTTLDFQFFATGAGGTQSFTPSIYSVLNGQRNQMLGAGAPVTVPMGAAGQWYSAPLPGVVLTAGTQYELVIVPSGVKSTYIGSELDGTFAFFVDYQ